MMQESNDLVKLCHLYVLSSARVFNLYTQLVFVVRFIRHVYSSRRVQTSLACSTNPQRVSLGCLSNSFSYLKTFLFLDVSGYIKKATAKKLSSKSNPYLDTIIQSEHGTQ